MTTNQIFNTQKSTRTEIADLPESAVELSEMELRIVSGGISNTARGCSSKLSPLAGMKQKTQKNTNGDWDTDWETPTFPVAIFR